MTGAMYAAIGGLQTHMTNLNVIGNNIANVNTVAYKAQRMIFEESIYTTMYAGSDGTAVRGGNTPSQIGYGAQVGSIDLNMAPGTYNPTGYGLDCMIQGDGFFMLGTKDMEFNSAEDYTKATLTRAGDLDVDPNGYITKGKGGDVVMGFAMVYNPDYNPNATEDEIKAAAMNGKNIGDKLILSTQLVPLRIPLAAREPTAAEREAAKAAGTEWNVNDPVYGMLDVPVEGSTARKNISLADDSFYTAGDDGEMTFAVPEGVGQPLNPDGTPNDTQLVYTGPIPNTQDKCVTLTGMQINSNGAIVGVADNGDTIVVGYVAIAQVDAPNGVTHVGGPFYKAMEGAGEMTVGIAGGLLEPGTYLNNQIVIEGEGDDAVATPGIKDVLGQMKAIKLQNSGLEASTADVATEFANMIVTQRGYQANTRIITVTDSMLEELVNMKR